MSDRSQMILICEAQIAGYERLHRGCMKSMVSARFGAVAGVVGAVVCFLHGMLWWGWGLVGAASLLYAAEKAMESVLDEVAVEREHWAMEKAWYELVERY